MARAMITCPNTGKAIYTDMSFGKITFETSQVPDRSVLCPEELLSKVVYGLITRRRDPDVLHLRIGRRE